MLNDIIKTYSSTGTANPVWETPATKRNDFKDDALKFSTDKAVRTDTIEISGKPENKDAAYQVSAAKTSVVSELSSMHTDVNKFLQIKDQVRNGTYELNAEEIAKSISGYTIF